MASKEANKAKYQYNKKYMEAYWERRAQRENGQVETVKRREKSVTLSTDDKDFFPELAKMDVETSVKREGRSDAKYIKALEDANRMYRSENKRLIRLLTKYQEVIKLGLTALKQKEGEETRTSLQFLEPQINLIQGYMTTNINITQTWWRLLSAVGSTLITLVAWLGYMALCMVGEVILGIVKFIFGIIISILSMVVLIGTFIWLLTL